MSEILSQSEIDALLSALSSGDLTPEKATAAAAIPEEEHVRRTVKIYDFKRQNKFSKDHIRTLSMIHEAFSRLLSTSLSGQLRMLVQIEVVSVEQLTFDEYSRSLPSPTILNVFTMEPLVGTSLFEINIDITSAIIDRLLGGPGRVTRIRRDLTDIERTLISSITQRLLSTLSEAWQNILTFSPKLETMEMNPRFVQIVPPTDPVVLITFEAKFGENTGPLSLCIPYIVLEPVMSKISAQAMFATQRQSQSTEYRANLQGRVNATYVPFQVVLGEAEVTVSDVVSLGIGDVLPLSTSVEAELSVLVSEQLKFKGKPGTLRNKMAIQITEVVDNAEGEEA
ncbi:MAG TPA: flagellar motor switch protein FliM [Pantanalinema sp.]